MTRICKSLIISVLKNMIIFLKKHVHVFHKSRTCFCENTSGASPGYDSIDIGSGNHWRTLQQAIIIYFW